MNHSMPRRAIQAAALAFSLAAHAFGLSLCVQSASAAPDHSTAEFYQRAFAANDTGYSVSVKNS